LSTQKTVEVLEHLFHAGPRLVQAHLIRRKT
jgi:hypothetical protein